MQNYEDKRKPKANMKHTYMDETAYKVWRSKTQNLQLKWLSFGGQKSLAENFCLNFRIGDHL